MSHHERYQRQEIAFPHERRAKTFLAELGGEHASWTSAMLKAGAAAAGIPQIWSDYHGPSGEGGHWLLGDHEALVKTVNGDVEYDFLDPTCLYDDLQVVMSCHENPWVVVHANDPAGALAAVEQLMEVAVPVLVLLTAPGGVVVQRHPNPAAAARHLAGLARRGRIPGGPAELSIVAAGIALDEIMLSDPLAEDDPAEPRIVAFYSLGRRRRIGVSPDTAMDELVEELTAPAKRFRFSRRWIKQVGAGALGNWTAIAVALDGGVRMDVIDGDPQVERHNLNRQILLVDGVGQPKAPVLTRELERLDPAGSYRDITRFVEQPEDLEPLDGVDAVIMAPDNDAARLRGADVAWRWAVPYAVGGTSAGGGQLVVQQPGRACYRCITGLTDEAASTSEDPGANSCARGANQSIVASNMVVAGLLISELREAMAGRRSQNLRFFGGRGGNGNRLGRMTSDPECSHLADVGSKAEPCSVGV